MNLEEAILAVKRILVEAMASDSLSRYTLANISELVDAAKVIGTFGMDLLLEPDKVGATAGEAVAAGELLAMLADVNGEDPPMPQAGGMIWIMIAYKLAELILRLREEG